VRFGRSVIERLLLNTKPMGGFVFATLAVPFAERGETPIDNVLPNIERLLHESVTIALRLILRIPGLEYRK
jgi:hypothetical protein